jgi:hypothetical protein
MKLLTLIVGFCLLVGQTKEPNFIGMVKDDIINYMQKNNPGFDLDANAKNDTYKYLKFVDKYNEETYLFFLDENDLCTRAKLMSDFSNLKLRTDELNKKFKKAGENKWLYLEKGTTYFIELKKEEWFFTIVTKKKK